MRTGEPPATPRPTSVLEVAISQGEADICRTEARSTAGDARAIAHLDVAALLARHDDLRQAVLISAASGRGRLNSDRLLREVGRTLFGASLGAGEVAGLYRASAALAVERSQELRIVVRIDDPFLATLPWEAMYDEASGAYVCRRDQLVRHVSVASATKPSTVDPPLRILAVISSPDGLDELDVAAERRQLNNLLSDLTDEREVELVWAPSAVWADLQETLLDGPWHVVHFVGHGKLDPDLSEGALALVQRDGSADWVGANRIVDLLRRARPVPRLVVLNSCSGATIGTNDLFSSTAAALIRGGVNAVTAMQYEFSDLAAPAFTRGFYSALARGQGVDEAVSNGRVAIIGLNGKTLEWVTPVLYLRGSDSHLFRISASAPRFGGNRATAVRPSTDEIPSPAAHPGGATERPRPGYKPPHLIRILSRHTAGIRCLAFSPSQPLLASVGDDAVLQLWQTSSGTNIQSIRTQTRSVNSVAFSPDGQHLAVAGMGGRFLWLWETATGKFTRRLAGHSAGVLGVAFSPAGGLLASGSSDQSVRLWTLSAKAETTALTGHKGAVSSVAFSSDGRLLASGSADRTVRLWSLPAGIEATPPLGHADPVTSVALSPGRALLASTAGAAVYLWNPATGTAKRTLTGHRGLVYDVAFSAQGHLLASAGADKTVRLWDTMSGEELQRLAGHEAAVIAVAFSPDGGLLASGGSDHTIRLWGLD